MTFFQSVKGTQGVYIVSCLLSMFLILFITVFRSKDFHDFLSLCVVKSPEMRYSAADLITVSRWCVGCCSYAY